MHRKRKVKSKLLNFPPELNLAAHVLKDGCLLSRKQMIYWFPLKRKPWQELSKQKLPFSRAFNMGSLKQCRVCSALLEPPFRARLWTPGWGQPCPSPHLDFALLLVGMGSPVAPGTCTLHPWAGCRDAEFLKSVRVHWGFSFHLSFLFPSFLPVIVWTSRFISSLPPFCEDREEVTGGFGFFFFKPIPPPPPLSTINCFTHIAMLFSPQIPTKKSPRQRLTGITHFGFCNYFRIEEQRQWWMSTVLSRDWFSSFPEWLCHPCPSRLIRAEDASPPASSWSELFLLALEQRSDMLISWLTEKISFKYIFSSPELFEQEGEDKLSGISDLPDTCRTCSEQVDILLKVLRKL